MSLQVWLPLNGNLNNQGLKNIQAVGNGITLDNSGKIGQCYSFDGTDDYITLNNITCSGWTEFSLTCWCYPTTDFNSLFLIRGNSAHRIRIADNGITFRDSNNSTLRTIGFRETIPQNQWVHIACIYNRGEISMYINGILTNHNTSYYHSNSILLSDHNEVRIARSQSTSGNSYYTGKINDFRIYDHALSAKEIEEISKGLLLHYKLNNILNNDNNIYDCSGFGNNGIIAGGTYSLSNDTARYSKSISLPNDNWIRVLKYPGITCSKDAITVNIWAKINASWTYNRGSIISCQEGSGWAIAKASDNLLYFEVYADGAYRIAKASETSYTSALIGNWHMLTGTADSTTVKLYFDGELIATGENTATTNFRYINNYIFIGGDAKGVNNETPYSAINGLFSDCRIYATVLTDAQIKELYNTGLSIDNSQKIHTFELEETNPNLFAGIPWTQPYSSHSKTYSLKTDFNENGEYIFTSNNISAGSDYIEIEPGIYEYDITISVNTGNQFYIGFHRYDANKTSRSNNACIYIISIKPTTDIVKKRYKGTVNLSTDGTNPCKYISLRILNGWSGTTSGVTGQSTIHNLSLRKQSNINSPSITKKGQLICDEFKEDAIASIYKNGIVESLNIIEN